VLIAQLRPDKVPIMSTPKFRDLLDRAGALLPDSAYGPISPPTPRPAGRALLQMAGIAAPAAFAPPPEAEERSTEPHAATNGSRSAHELEMERLNQQIEASTMALGRARAMKSELSAIERQFKNFVSAFAAGHRSGR
jgi:hypothetical protein